MTTQTAVVAPDYGAMLNSLYAIQMRLLTGTAATEIHDQNGERVVYTVASLPKVNAMIAYLEVKTGTKRLSALGPLGAFF